MTVTPSSVGELLTLQPEAESLGVNSANFSGITADESVDGTTDVHVRRVYAIWKQNAPATQHKNTYVFDANGGTITGSTDTTSTIANANPAEAANVAAPKAEKAGYTFVGGQKTRVLPPHSFSVTTA